MPFRTRHSYSTSSGTTVIGRQGAKTSTAKRAPAGTRKIKAPTIATVPVVTTSPTGHVTTQNFSSPRAASQAKRQARSSQRRVRRIEAQQASALGFHRRTQQRASEATPRVPGSNEYKQRRVNDYVSPRLASQAPKAPSYKPPKFQGAKTAGTPTLGSLRKAQSKGLLRTNRKGYVTTPQVRKVSGTLKRLESKAREKTGPLPGLTAQQSKVAATVLRRGDKAGATRKEKLAAAETGLVESSFQNLPGGDADSEGWRQERTSFYGTGPTGPRNVRKSADRFYAESVSDTSGRRGRGQTAGELAQTVQGSAYPERYDEVKPQANAIVKAFEHGSLKPAQQRKLAQAQVKARKLGLNVSGASKVGPAPPKVVTRFKAIKAAAGALTKRHIPYVWGGGHGAIESAPSGLDCSGAVSWVLNKAGILKTPLTSGSMGEVLEPGPGAVTVFYNAGHTFMKIGNQYWGTSVGDSGAGGLGPHPAPSASYLAQYRVGHVPGLGKKQALQLGFSPTASESFPGMTLSASGTTATVNESATATRDKPGFSKSPIKLTPNQKAHRTLKKLEQVGAGLSEKPSEGSESKASVLTELERHYGSKAA